MFASITVSVALAEAPYYLSHPAVVTAALRPSTQSPQQASHWVLEVLLWAPISVLSVATEKPPGPGDLPSLL